MEKGKKKGRRRGKIERNGGKGKGEEEKGDNEHVMKTNGEEEEVKGVQE